MLKATRPPLRLVTASHNVAAAGASEQTLPANSLIKITLPAQTRRLRWPNVTNDRLLVWVAIAHATLVPIAFLIPTRGLLTELFVLSGIVCAAGLLRLFVASSNREGRGASAYAIWAVVTNFGALVLIAAPLLGVASASSALAFFLAAEAGATVNISRVQRANESWSVYAGVTAVLALLAFLTAPILASAGFAALIAVDLLAATVCCAQTGMQRQTGSPMTSC